MTEKELNEQKKDYLNSYKKLCRKLQSLEERLQSLRETERAAKTQQITDMPKGGKQTDLSDYMVRVDTLEQEIYDKSQECICKKLEIERCIVQMDDGTECDVLHKRYIELKPWEKICVEINYSWMQTHRIHGNALNSFMIINGIE
ncbi:MAG: DUF1492 domain-containing protein [Anaerocolumna sp.]